MIATMSTSSPDSPEDVLALGSYPAMCITAIAGRSVSDAATALTVEDDSEPLSPEQAAKEPAVGLRSVPGGVIAVEYNGWEGRRSPLLRACSTDGRTASAYWSANGIVEAHLAERGRLVAIIEGGVARTHDMSFAAIVDELIADLDLGIGGPRIANSVLLVRRYTGVQFTADDVLSVEEFLPILPVLDDPPSGVVHDERWQLVAANRVGSRVLLDAIVASDSASLRSFALWAADQSLAHANVGEAALHDAVRQAATRPGADLPQETIRLIRVLAKQGDLASRLDPALEQGETRIASMRMNAATAVLAATSFADPLDAAVGAATAARLGAGPDRERWTQRAITQLLHDNF